MKRLLLPLLLAIAALGAIGAAPVAALSYSGYTYSSNFGGWVDDNCDSFDSWQVVIYSNVITADDNDKTKICHGESQFTQTPLIDRRGQNGCNNIPEFASCLWINNDWWLSANDVVSWAKVTKWELGPTCSLRFYENTGYSPSTGLKIITGGVGSYSFAGVGQNDHASSVKAVCL